MQLDLMLAFVLATLTFMVTPGPGSLYCAAQSLAHGTRTGLNAALGLHLGGYVHVIAASLGLSVLFETIPLLFTVMKFAGALVLIWMGIGLLRRRLTGDLPALPKAGPSSVWRAFLVEALNPTTALFFLAFLPQFVSPEGSWPISLQFLVLGTIVGFVFSLADLFYAVTAGSLQKRLRTNPRIRIWAQRTGGAVLVGLGLNLVFSRST